MPAAEAAATALLLIDFQKGFLDPFWGARNNPQAEDNALRLIAAFRQHGVPVLHVRHLSRTPGSPLSGRGTDFKDGFTPAAGEALFEKSVNSAFIGTDLEAKLRAQGITRLVICGLTTPHCVSTTTRMAANLGFAVTLVHDACAAFARNADVSFDNGPAYGADEIHRAALAHLHNEFATVAGTVAVLSGLSA